MLTSSNPHKLNISLPKHKGNLQQPQPFAVGREVKFWFCWFCDWSGSCWRSGSGQSEGVVWSVVGEDIRMMCTISNLGNRTVSWLRHRDIHLLTHGVTSYTDDRRFSAYMDILSNTWQLRIKNVSVRSAVNYIYLFFMFLKTFPDPSKQKQIEAKTKSFRLRSTPLTDLPGQQLLLHNFTLSHPQSQNDSDGFHK